MHLSLLLLATLLSPVLAASTDYILSHRFLSIPPSHHRHHPPSFQPYKLLTLTTSTDSRSPPDVSLADENFSSEGGPRHGEVDDGTGWYQVRLEDVGDGMEMLASTRAVCRPSLHFLTLHHSFLSLVHFYSLL